MIVLTNEQAMVFNRLLTCILLNATYHVLDVVDALVWMAPENRQILMSLRCPLVAKPG